MTKVVDSLRGSLDIDIICGPFWLFFKTISLFAVSRLQTTFLVMKAFDIPVSFGYSKNGISILFFQTFPIFVSGIYFA